tara:strand:+ start:273 stop:431 length:159 start_codon:yes stop_codon:yes gene_type:complete
LGRGSHHGVSRSDPDLICFSREFFECYRVSIGDAMLNGGIPPEKKFAVFNVK